VTQDRDQIAGPFLKHSSEPSGSTKDGEFDHLKNLAPCSQSVLIVAFKGDAEAQHVGLACDTDTSGADARSPTGQCRHR
jgi:hypothetical protein